jgi:hypothetical protein
LVKKLFSTKNFFKKKKEKILIFQQRSFFGKICLSKEKQCRAVISLWTMKKKSSVF